MYADASVEQFPETTRWTDSAEMRLVFPGLRTRTRTSLSGSGKTCFHSNRWPPRHGSYAVRLLGSPKQGWGTSSHLPATIFVRRDTMRTLQLQSKLQSCAKSLQSCTTFEFRRVSESMETAREDLRLEC